MEQLDKIIKKFKLETEIPSIKLSATRRDNIPITSSKLGGKPYYPRGLEYPRNLDGIPLKLLAQLNFSELPKLKNFPEKGMLQFYILSNIYMGLDYDNPTVQNDFRVIYHEEVLISEQSDYLPLEETRNKKVFFPFEGEFILIGEAINHAMTSADYRFENLFNTICESHGYPERFGYGLDFNEEFCEKVSDRLMGKQIHLVGGYPNFTQRDPREYNQALRKYDSLLFQIESQYPKNSGIAEIIWGDVGVANFFINLENLKNCKFDDVMYTMDCS